jgi:hypothetical protein
VVVRSAAHCEGSPTEVGFLERVAYPGDKVLASAKFQACSTVV